MRGRVTAGLCAAAFATAGYQSQEVMAHGGESHGETAAPITNNLNEVLGRAAISPIIHSEQVTVPTAARKLVGDKTGRRLTAVAAPTTPFHPLLETRPVTVEEIESYMPIIKAESPNSPCNAPEDGNSHGFKINILPGSDDDSDPNNDMMSIMPDGSIRMVMGRSRGNCMVDFLNFNLTGSQGRYNVCTVGSHEGKHEDISLTPEGYIAPPSEQDPTGQDRKHDFNNVNSLMYAKILTQNYRPCASITTDLEPPIGLPAPLAPLAPHAPPAPSAPAEPRKYKPYSVEVLAYRAAEYIPRLKKASENNQVICDSYHRKPSAPEFSRRLCYTGRDESEAMNSTIITIKSIFTIDGTNSGRPVFTSDKIPDRIARRYLKYGPLSGPLSTKAGRRAYRRQVQSSKKRASEPPRHAKASHV